MKFSSLIVLAAATSVVVSAPVATGQAAPVAVPEADAGILTDGIFKGAIGLLNTPSTPDITNLAGKVTAATTNLSFALQNAWRRLFGLIPLAS